MTEISKNAIENMMIDFVENVKNRDKAVEDRLYEDAQYYEGRIAEATKWFTVLGISTRCNFITERLYV